MYKILSIDGGGIHGYFSLILIKRLLETNPRLIEDVDLITGTSIGGILGLGFALGHPVESIEDNFIKGMPLAFNTNNFRFAGFVAGITTKYDNKKFERFLKVIYGPKELNDLEKKVVIPAFCIDNEGNLNRRWKAKIFHNFSGVDSDGHEKVADVAMATSSAPVFFKAHTKYIDGAIVANNPSFCAALQTQDTRSEINPRPKLEDIAILSLGSIRDIYIPNRNMDWGYFMWSRSLLNMLTERDTLMVNYTCKSIFNERYHRIESVINGPMDNCEEIKNIRAIANQHPIEKTIDWLKEYWR